MGVTKLKNYVSRCDTPAIVYDEGDIRRSLDFLRQVRSKSGCRVLFSLKSFAVIDALRLMVPMVDGFSASSFFEAQLAREVIDNRGSVHITTPGFRPDEIEDLAEICDYISLNSIPQWKRFREQIAGKASCGLRINPQLSFVKDERYDPCRKHSKLGIPMDQLVALLERDAGNLNGVRGLHFHTNCESGDFAPLLKTVQHIDRQLSALLARSEWVNLGGGYLFEHAEDLTPLYQAIDLLRAKYNVDVFVEPGTAIAGEAGSLISTVLDLFDSNGKTVAVLDTTVNHIPEVLEYQYRPHVFGDTPDNEHNYILAGCTCLAGDIFGEYNFSSPLKIGSRIVFLYCGAYSLVKAHMFNGMNLPTIYMLKSNERELEIVRQFGYDDYISRLGGNQV